MADRSSNTFATDAYSISDKNCRGDKEEHRTFVTSYLIFLPVVGNEAVHRGRVWTSCCQGQFLDKYVAKGGRAGIITPEQHLSRCLDQGSASERLQQMLEGREIVA